MKAIVIKSNHGNHTGFNRSWQVLNHGQAFDSIEEAREYLWDIVAELEDYIEPENRSAIGEGQVSYRHDGRTYVIVTESDIDDGFFNGGTNGYMPTSVKEIFGITENE